MSEGVHERIAAALARIGGLARAHEARSARGEDLSPLQARILAVLLRRSRLRVGELAAELLVTDATVSAAVSALEAKGLVLKESAPEEHRAVVVRLSRRGGAAARRAERWSGELLLPVVAELDEADADALLGRLLQLVRAFERRGLLPSARMCLSCRYFRPWHGRGKKPHRCELLREAIGEGELRLDCGEHEPAAPERLEEIWHELQGAGG